MKNVLVSPLNWGSGHATRMVPLINWLSIRANVTIGGNGESIALLKKLFPNLEVVSIPGVEIKLGNTTWVNYLLLALQLPMFLWAKRRERDWLNKNAEQFDLVISDNRYGLFHQSIRSIIVTHQTAPPFPIFKKIGHSVIKKWLTKFNEVWIPDNKFIGLTKPFWQELNGNPTVQFIGWLSAWEQNFTVEEDYWLILASGPEPGKSNFVSTIKSKVNIKVKVADGLVGTELYELIAKAKGIIAKAGYSTIMDVLLHKKKALLIPTPGQIEQEQLAKNTWLKDQLAILNWNEVRATSKLNLENARTPSNIDMPNVWQNVLLTIIDEND